MLNDLRIQLEELLQNQVVSGGLVFMLAGTGLALLRRLPRQLGAALWKRCTISIEILDDDRAFEWFSDWLDKLPYTGRARRLTIKTRWRDGGDRQVLFAPAPGLHWFWIRGHLLLLKRT